MQLRSGAASDVGKIRPSNQDMCLNEQGIYAVADGMGGHAGGGFASNMAVDIVRSVFAQSPSLDGLRKAVAEANIAIWRQSQSQPDLRGMGTTLTLAANVVSDQGQDVLAVANVGDSRCYLYSKGILSQVSVDHSLAEEKVRMGEMTVEEAAVHPQRHILTRALGIGPDVLVDLWELRVEAGDRILLCSDGLTNEMSDEDIAHTLGSALTPTQASQLLVRAANDRGGHDNTSVVLVDILGEGLNAAPDLGSGVFVAQAPSVPKEKPRTGSRLITFRVIAFLLLLAGVPFAGAGFIQWYGKDNWFVTVSKANQVVIYQGRPGGLLWVKPKLVDHTGVSLGGVLGIHWQALKQDVNETSLTAAKSYVMSLHDEYVTQKRIGNQETHVGTPTLGTVPPTVTTTAPTTTTTTPNAPTTTTQSGQGSTTTTTTGKPATTTTQRKTPTTVKKSTTTTK